MQFQAFLRDSYREARSGWMLQIMLILATLLILLVGSIGFRPTTVDDVLGLQLRFLSLAFQSNPNFDRIGRPEWSLQNVQPRDKAALWKSDYDFDFVVKTATKADAIKALHPPAELRFLPVNRRSIEFFVGSNLKDFQKIEVKEPPPPAEITAFMAIGSGALIADPPVGETEMRYAVSATGNKIDDPLAAPHQVSVLFFYEPVFLKASTRDGAYYIEKWLVNGAGSWLALFVGIIITAGFMPSMLAKGSLDLFISKPIGRTRLLIYKYVGGLVFIFLLTAYTVLGVWLMVGLRTGLWNTNFLAILPIMSFYFAVLYAVSTFTSVMTRSTIVSILVTGLAWGAFWGIGKWNDGIVNREEAVAKDKNDPAAFDPDAPPDAEAPLRKIDPDTPLWGFIPTWTFGPVKALHTITPRTYQLDDRLGRVIAEGVLTPYQLKKQGYGDPPRTSWGEMVIVSLGFIAVMLGISAWRFNVRDY